MSCVVLCCFVFKEKTAYEMRISDWSSDVCSSDLQVDSMGQKIHRLETVNEQLTHEIAIVKRHKFAKRSEQLSPDQGSLLDDLLDTAIAAIEAKLKVVNPPPATAAPSPKPKRAAQPSHFPRTAIHHAPDKHQLASATPIPQKRQAVTEQ